MEKFKKRLGVVAGEAYILGLLVFVFLNQDGEWFAREPFVSIGMCFAAMALCVGMVAFAVCVGLNSQHFWGTFASMLVVQSTVLLLAGGAYIVFGHLREDFLATNVFLHPTSGMLCLGLFSLGLSYFYKVAEKSYASNRPPNFMFDGYDLAVSFTLVCFAIYLGGTIYVLPLQSGTIAVLSSLILAGSVAAVVLGVVKLMAEFWRRKR